MKDKIIRLSKIISHAGICSRREAEQLIDKGKVEINGKIYNEYTIKNDIIKTIVVSGEVLKKNVNRLWIFNKPVGLYPLIKNKKIKRVYLDYFLVIFQESLPLAD